jgi:hypothetical protein
MMKYLALGLLLFSFTASALELKVSKVSRDGQMERSFLLKTNLTQKVYLDCQSFMQGLYIGERSNNNFSLLDPDQCQSLYERIKESVSNHQRHCIDVESNEVRADYSCQ